MLCIPRSTTLFDQSIRRGTIPQTGQSFGLKFFLICFLIKYWTFIWWLWWCNSHSEASDIVILFGCNSLRAAEKDLEKCRQDCGGKQIEPGFKNNTCNLAINLEGRQLHSSTAWSSNLSTNCYICDAATSIRFVMCLCDWISLHRLFFFFSFSPPLRYF